MNRFVKLFLLLACTAAATTLAAQDSTQQVVQVVFTPDMDKADLDSIQKSVKALGVDLQINATKYEAGLLRTIDFSITTESGKGSARGEIRPDRKFGFQCYPHGGTSYAVVAGALDGAPDEEK